MALMNLIVNDAVRASIQELFDGESQGVLDILSNSLPIGVRTLVATLHLVESTELEAPVPNGTRRFYVRTLTMALSQGKPKPQHALPGSLTRANTQGSS